MQEQIFDALRRGAHDEALDAARAAVAAEPNASQPQLWLAMALKAAGRHDEAIAAIDHGIALSPEDADLHVHRAGLLLGARDLQAAQSALAQAVTLDPNQFGAYVMQAHLALAEGKPEEAERLSKLAARLAPEHPWSLALDGTLALHRGDADTALSLSTRALEMAPDDARVLLAAGLAYRQKGHHAFAEQMFRRLLDSEGAGPGSRLLLVQTMQVQRRPEDALEALQPLLKGDAPAHGLLRLAGELALQSGRTEEGMASLRRVLQQVPDDEPALFALMQAWRMTGDTEDARRTLEDALAKAPASALLWRARLAVEDTQDGADGIVDRWNTAAPGHVGALEARMQQHRRRGELDAAEAVAQRILAEMPGNALAHGLVVDRLHARDPGAAIDYVDNLLSQAGGDAAKEQLLVWLGALEDSAGRYAQAVARWTMLAELRRPAQLPLTPVSLLPDKVPAGDWPAWDTGGDAGNASRDLQTLFLWGPPGSCVEYVATQLSAFDGFRADRMSAAAPGDGFQRFASIDQLSSGELSGAMVADEWRKSLEARGIAGEHVIDWLVWWDNALLRALRPHFPAAGVVFVVRDPRDMLLQWLARGSPMQFSVPSPLLAAQWMSAVLSQMADTVAQPLFRSVLLKIDGIEGDAAAIGVRLSEALGLQVPVVPVAADILPAGHWRKYAEALAEPFAVLTPIAKQLGYPED
ncbi:tetratricopeptide repeat protein [Luteimonas aestuarii]|uniref:Tetratricopeptide repeat protein n=1 Tax=Luteimonas aestuarii TaxID=453837 RepID=A0A4V6PLM9_9GAMM|nr:tetratricopeptide repeat protein [Luteimonas aestuarii]TDK23854.1 tetratricopeptide repeat protein [Luteimonas aestuarii]